MHTKKRKKLEARGWKVGDTREFLKLSDADPPEITGVWIAEANLYHGNKLVRRARPKREKTHLRRAGRAD